MALRVRLTLLYVVLLAVALAAFGLLVYVIAAKRIYDGVDDTLSIQAEAVVSALQPLSGSPLSDQDIAHNRLALDSQTTADALFQIRDLEGRALYSALQPANRDLPLPKQVTLDEPVSFSRKVGGQRFRILYQPIVRDGETLGSVEVGQSLAETDAALDEIRYVLIAGGLSVLLVTSVSAYLVAGRALNPVRQLSRLARHIERTADFSRRLAKPQGGGEMRELIATFNAMIGRVERTLAGQRAFLADSSHELRRPLTVLRTNIDILSDPALPAEEREASLQEMRTEAEAMSRLLSDLLLLSREESQAIVRAPVDYTALCEQAVTRLRAQDDRHELVAEAAAGVRVLGDKERLAQMLWNLLQNARLYTPDGGRIELRLRHTDGSARVEIRDTGVGISEDDLPHIFERFYRGQIARANHTDGAGLGLAIVKYVAEAHGGTVRASSRPGRGSTFVVQLPDASASLIP